MNNRTLVILPKWIWDKATDNEQFKVNLSNYMYKNYPGYQIISIKKHEAICERG